MTGKDDPITRGEFDQMVRNMNEQLEGVVQRAVKAFAPAGNPPARRGDQEAWALVEELRRELRDRDRQELDEMRRDMRHLREERQDPLEQIGQARELVAALGPEPPSEMLSGLSYLSNVAEAYLEKRAEAEPSGAEATSDDAPAGPAEYGGPEEPHYSPEHPGAGSETSPGLGIQIVEGSG